MSTQLSKLALVLLCVIFILSSCEKDLSVQKAVHISEWSVDEFEPFDWNARFQELSKPSSLKSGNSDQPFKSPNPAELKRVYDFIDRPEHTLVIDKITEEIGTPDWDMTTKIKQHGNEYMLYTPLMTPSGEVNGLFQYHSDKSTNRQSFRAVRESSISSLVENNDSPLLGLVDVIGFMNTAGVATENVEEPINEWVFAQKPEGLKSDSSKSFATIIRVYYYHMSGINFGYGYYDVTTWHPCSDENTGGGTSDPFENDIDETIDGGSITIPTLELEDRLEIEIDNPKFNCIFNKLSSSSNKLFENVIQPFGLSNDMDLVFKDAENRPASGQCSDYPIWDGCTRTSGTANGEISIYINFNGNPHSLFLAGTILHEGIHAAIASYMNSCGVDISLMNPAELINAYSIHKTTNSADHAYILNNYIDPIANALSSIDSHSREYDFYKAIAWDGLRTEGAQLGFTSEQMLENFSLASLSNNDDCE